MSWKPAPWLNASGRTASFGQPKQRKRVRPVGQSRSQQQREYNNAKRRWIIGKSCAVYPNRRAVHVHHMRGRVGVLLLDQHYWLPVSFAGHRWIHDNPKQAQERGWLAGSGEWGKAD